MVTSHQSERLLIRVRTSKLAFGLMTLWTSKM